MRRILCPEIKEMASYIFSLLITQQNFLSNDLFGKKDSFKLLTLVRKKYKYQITHCDVWIPKNLTT
jgi:hypothetical protein